MKCAELRAQGNRKSMLKAVAQVRSGLRQDPDQVYLWNSIDGTPLYLFFDELQETDEADDLSAQLRICYELDGLDLMFTSAEEGAQLHISTMSQLLRQLDNRGGEIVLQNNRYAELADVIQQLIYIRYPLGKLRIRFAGTAEAAQRVSRIRNACQTLMDRIRRCRRCLDTMQQDIARDSPVDTRVATERILQRAEDACCKIEAQLMKLHASSLTVAVAASKKTGKSVIVNSMLTQEIAPTSLLKPTPNVCEYRLSFDDKYYLSPMANGSAGRSDGRPSKFLTLPSHRHAYPTRAAIHDALNQEFTAAMNQPETQYATANMRIEYPCKNPTGFQRLTILDTPGPDLAGAHHGAMEAVSSCDVLIFAIDYTKYLTNSEEAYLRQVAELFRKENKFGALILTVNKMDLMHEDARSCKSPVRALDFIRTRLQTLGHMTAQEDFYRTCVLFATSSLQYYDTIHCEEVLGNEFQDAADLSELQRTAAKLKRINPVVSSELMFLDNIIGYYKVNLGLEQVTTTVLKERSGIPALLDYIGSACETWLQTEIDNSIAKTIEEQTKLLQDLASELRETARE